VRRYAARLGDAGLSVFLLVGVNPLRSAKSAAWMRSHLFGTIIPDAMVARLEGAADAAAEGRQICIETIEELSRIPGVAGAHIMAPGNDQAIPDVIAAARRTVTMAARVA
jgi:methylenetetrahydrofolate reductase (NADPH)